MRFACVGLAAVHELYADNSSLSRVRHGRDPFTHPGCLFDLSDY